MRSRCASSSLPSASNQASRSCSSASIPPMATLHALVAGDVVGGREDHQLVELGQLLAGQRCRRVLMRSISSPNSSIRTACSS